MNERQLRAAYFTLGCKLNFSETSEIGRLLSERGILRAQGLERPDIVVVNTCAVTQMADKKGRQLIRRLHSQWPQAAIFVTGCHAQLQPEETASLEGVEMVVGNDRKMDLPELLDRWLEDRTRRVEVASSLQQSREFQGACERGDRTRWWLKVQDGCDYFCTYCTIPYARGRSRSGRIADLVAQVRQAAAEGAKEIVLTGVNVGCFGLDTGESFFELLRQLDAVEGIERFRISSIEPNLITEEIIDWIASKSRAFMPHFHIPLQSGSDAVLRVMHRRYDTALFRSRLEYIKERITDAFIGVDIIAGARGETEEEWRNSLEFLRAVPWTRLHVFPYSERPGTKAVAMNGEAACMVEPQVRHRRVAELQRLSTERVRLFNESFRGTARPVLWEHLSASDPAMMQGHTDNYIPVSAPADPALFNTVTLATLNGPDPSDPEAMRGTISI